MNKKDLVNSLTNILSSKKEANDVVEKIFAEIKRSLREGDRVVVSEFGVFNAFVAKAKKGHDPNTGKTIQIAPRKKVRFKQIKTFFD